MILVTGGSGMIGSALAEISPGIFLSSRDVDLTSESETFHIFEKLRPTSILHLAANVGGLYKNMNDSVGMLEDNLKINMNVLKVAHAIGVTRLVSCLSTCIFPDRIEYPIDAGRLHDGPPHPSNEGYAYAKRILEIQSRLYRKQYGVKYTCVIPTNLYGPHDNFCLENGHVIPSLIHRCYLAHRDGHSFLVRGSGRPLRQFLFSRDMARLLLWTLEHEETDDEENLILTSPTEVSIGEVAGIIADCFHYRDQMIFDQDSSDGQFRKTVSTAQLDRYLPGFQFTSLEEGIRETVQWFVTHYDTCRRESKTF